MPVILNETEYAENIIKKGEVGSKPTSTLFLLGKYFRQKKGFNKEQTSNELNKFMADNYKGYNSALWEDIIEDISKKAHKYPLKEIEFVGITQAEMDKIKELQSPKYERLLFVMLCYAKLHNLMSAQNNGWVNADIQELYRTARVTVKHRNDKFLYLNDLEKTGLISFSSKNDNLNLRVNFIGTASDIVLKIHDFRELGYEYLNYLGEGRFVRCFECNRLVRRKKEKDFSTKYCADCAKYIKNEQNKIYYHDKI